MGTDPSGIFFQSFFFMADKEMILEGLSQVKKTKMLKHLNLYCQLSWHAPRDYYLPSLSLIQAGYTTFPSVSKGTT